MNLIIDFYGCSVKGRRDNNQDAYIAEKIAVNTYLFAVADGMGGTKGGEIASQLTLKSIFVLLKEKFNEGGEKISLKDILNDAVLAANHAIQEEKEKNTTLQGMGTTLTLMVIHNGKYSLVHVGDSRAYLTDGNTIEQLTTDHTYIEDYKTKNKGVLPEEIKQKYSNYLIQAMDGSKVNPDFYPQDKAAVSLKPEGAFLLCSDGLILDKEYTNINLFKNYLTGTPDCKTAAHQLVNYAYNYGSTDNLTALVITFGSFKRKPLNLRKFPDISETEEKCGKAAGKQKKIKPGLRVFWILAAFLFVFLILYFFIFT